MPEEAKLLLLDYLSKNYQDLRRRLLRSLRSPELADDALHDTWLRLQRLENQAPVFNPRAFLLRMAVNTAINQLRSQSRIVPSNEIDALLEVADPAPSPELAAATDSQMRRMMEIIQSMPQRRRDVLLLVRWEGMMQKDVATQLGVSLRTVELELKRALDSLAARMGDRK